MWGGDTYLLTPIAFSCTDSISISLLIRHRDSGANPCFSKLWYNSLCTTSGCLTKSILSFFFLNEALRLFRMAKLPVAMLASLPLLVRWWSESIVLVNETKVKVLSRQVLEKSLTWTDLVGFIFCLLAFSPVSLPGPWMARFLL